MYTQNSISSLVAQFLRLQKNALEIINGLNQVATSTNDNVEIQLLDEFGFPTTSSIPAYGYLRSQIQRLDSNIEALAGLGQNFSTIRNPDGTYSQIYKVEPLRDPLPLVGLPVPSTFATRDNWFYESFLSPLLYINVDVTGQIPDSAARCSRTSRDLNRQSCVVAHGTFERYLLSGTCAAPGTGRPCS